MITRYGRTTTSKTTYPDNLCRQSDNLRGAADALGLKSEPEVALFGTTRSWETRDDGNHHGLAIPQRANPLDMRTTHVDANWPWFQIPVACTVATQRCVVQFKEVRRPSSTFVQFL